jgi:hypothetical protein
MHYSNIKKLYSNKNIKALMLIAIVIYGAFFALGHSQQKAYAASTWSTPGYTEQYTWLSSSQIQLKFTSGTGSTALDYYACFNYTVGDTDLNGNGIDFYIAACTGKSGYANIMSYLESNNYMNSTTASSYDA